MQRRAFLRSSLGIGFGTLIAGVTAGSRVAGASGSSLPGAGKAASCVLVFLHGGASQIDTFDPKPGRPTGGEFEAIETSIRGVRFSQHLPQLARRLDQMNLIRSLTAKEGNHDRARYLMHTGFIPQGGVKHPAWGSVVARRHERGELPNYVALNGPGHAPGYLGARYAAFPIGNPQQPVRNLAPNRTIDDQRLDRRMQLWRELESDFLEDHPTDQVRGQREIGERAVRMMRASQASAFDLSGESDKTRARYGPSRFGLGCLMARRLVEADVPFVEVALRGWDTHQDNFARVKDLSLQLDAGLSALVDDLRSSGRLDSTLVVVMGDFGRTPNVNARGGRDHYPRASSMLVAGGGTKRGSVIGATDPDGYEIAQRPVSVADLFSSFAHALGVAGDETFMTPQGRPVTSVDDAGKVVEELFV
jgi:hypothetical protein